VGNYWARMKEIYLYIKFDCQILWNSENLLNILPPQMAKEDEYKTNAPERKWENTKERLGVEVIRVSEAMS
jgi:hypothetical protein